MSVEFSFWGDRDFLKLFFLFFIVDLCLFVLDIFDDFSGSKFIEDSNRFDTLYLLIPPLYLR